MGLQERKAIENFQQNEYKKLKKSLDETAGFSLTIDIDWDSIAKEGYPENYANDFSKLYFLPLLEALKAICCDELGKKALQNNLENIIVCNHSETYGRSAISFTNRVLKIDHRLTNVDYVEERTEAIKEVLGNALTGDKEPPKIRDLVQKMPARPIRDILCELQYLKNRLQNQSDGNVVSVTFTFSHGGCVTGKVIEIKTDSKPGLVLLAVESNYQRHDLIYFSTDSIQMIRIHNVDEFLPSFSSGKVDPLHMKPSPGKLTIERNLLTVSDSLQEALGKKLTFSIDWESFNTDSFLQMGSISELLENFEASVKSKTDDKDFITEFNKKFGSVHISGTSEKAISYEDNCLQIKYPGEGKKYERLSQQDIIDGINAVL
ncbi:hypothetical protein [Candidatus Uabimicrobium sp. HlEnr_7]|uniref:hypothetical protein n=1 Tax=Candidatus Uabimicrobium helgolandensis TaxID=3095367 RepID=UPI003558B1FA